MREKQVMKVAPGRAMKLFRLLIIDASEHDAELIEHEIRRGGFDVRAARVTTTSQMREQRSHTFPA